MFLNTPKTVSVLGISVLMSGMLFAAHTDDSSRLGQKCAQKTMHGLIQLIKRDHKGMRHSQGKVAKYIKQAVTLKSLDQRKLFLEAGIKALEAMNLNNGAVMIDTKVYQLEQSDRAYAIMVKSFGIEVFKKALDSVQVLPWGQGRANGFWNNRALFSALPFTTLQEENRAFAKAATQAYQDAYNCQESEETVALALQEYFEEGIDTCGKPLTGAAGLALELIAGKFGDRVGQFICGAHLFSPRN